MSNLLKLKVNLDYKQPEPKNEMEKATFLSPSELTSSYINFAAGKKFPNGIKGLSLRTFASIQNKLDIAVLDKKDSIELETAEVELLKEILKNDELEFPTNIARYIVILLDEFDNAVEDFKKKAAGK